MDQIGNEPRTASPVHPPMGAVAASTVSSDPRRGTPEDDIRIMERIRDDDRQAVVELVERYQHELVGFFYHQCWDQLLAEELAQDVFVNVYRARHRYQATAKLRTWLYRIAHNLWIDHIRRQRHGNVSLDAEIGGAALRLVDVLAAPAGADPDATSASQITDRIQQAVATLPAGQRDVFVLANNQGMKYQDIAEVLGIPEGTVKSRMHSAVRFLRDELQDLIES